MTVAFHLSAGRIIMLFNVLSSTKACRSFLVMFGFGTFADFIIRKIETTMNRDEGGNRISYVWDSLLATPSSEQ